MTLDLNAELAPGAENPQHEYGGVSDVSIYTIYEGGWNMGTSICLGLYTNTEEGPSD